MKKLFFVFYLVANVIRAQEIEPKNVIENFFNGFHKKDTLALRATTHKDIVMQSVAKTKEGNKVTTESFSNFLKSIKSLPENFVFEERILDYKVQSDGLLAHVWTPYEFYVNGNLSHKGTNSFTLVKEKEQWVIIHIIDTRMR